MAASSLSQSATIDFFRKSRFATIPCTYHYHSIRSNNLNTTSSARSLVCVNPSKKQIYVSEQTISSTNANDISAMSSSTSFGTSRIHKGMILYRPVVSGDQSGWEEVVGKRLTEISSSDTSKFVSSPLSLSTLRSSFNDEDSVKTILRKLPFLHHFLPARYPHSVCSSYSSYASYCFLGSIAGSAGMVLSTQALLVAVGVGTQSAAPMAAALNWVMKDGVGQLGGVLFASQLGAGGGSSIDMRYWKDKLVRWKLLPLTLKVKTRYYGNFQRGTADSNPKRWRMVAALALDLSTFLEICTPMMGSEWFLPCASVANIGKNIGFLAASASRAAIHQSLSMGGTTMSLKNANSMNLTKDTWIESAANGSNLGDVTAKAGSQAIMASLLGTTLGITLSQTFCSDHGIAGILTGFIVLSVVHQVCTYQAVKVVPIRSLDRHRLHIVLTSYLTENNDIIHGSGIQTIGNHADGIKRMKQTLAPEDVARKELFLPFVPPDDSVRWLCIGDSLVNICPSGVAELLLLLLPKNATSGKSCKVHDFEFNARDHEKYILKVSLPSNANRDGLIQLTFLEGATEFDIIRGMFHSYIAHTVLKNRHPTKIIHNNALDEYEFAILKDSHSKMVTEVPMLIDSLQCAGWRIGAGTVNIECGSSNRLSIGTD